MHLAWIPSLWLANTKILGGPPCSLLLSMTQSSHVVTLPPATFYPADTTDVAEVGEARSQMINSFSTGLHSRLLVRENLRHPTESWWIHNWRTSVLSLGEVDLQQALENPSIIKFEYGESRVPTFNVSCFFSPSNTAPKDTSGRRPHALA